MYLRRFEGMRNQVLNDKLYVKVVKIMREMNTECYLRVASSAGNQFDTALNLEDCEPKGIIYVNTAAPKTMEQVATFKMIVQPIEANQSSLYAEFVETKLY